MWTRRWLCGDLRTWLRKGEVVGSSLTIKSIGNRLKQFLITLIALSEIQIHDWTKVSAVFFLSRNVRLQGQRSAGA
jgi:hypothetical protein